MNLQDIQLIYNYNYWANGRSHARRAIWISLFSRTNNCMNCLMI